MISCSFENLSRIAVVVVVIVVVVVVVVVVTECANETSSLHDEMDRGSHFSNRGPWGGWGGR